MEILPIRREIPTLKSLCYLPAKNALRNGIPSCAKLDVKWSNMVFEELYRERPNQDIFSFLDRYSGNLMISNIYLKEIQLNERNADILKQFESLLSVGIQIIKNRDNNEGAWDIIEFLVNGMNPSTRQNIKHLKANGPLSYFDYSFAEIMEAFPFLQTLVFMGHSRKKWFPPLMKPLTYPNIKVLDISCSEIGALHSIGQLVNLEKLYMTNMFFLESDHLLGLESLNKLTFLDISDPFRKHFERELPTTTFCQFSARGGITIPNLEVLDVSRTKCSRESLKVIFAKNPTLKKVIMIETPFIGSTFDELEIWTSNSIEQLLEALVYYKENDREIMQLACLRCILPLLEERDQHPQEILSDCLNVLRSMFSKDPAQYALHTEAGNVWLWFIRRIPLPPVVNRNIIKSLLNSWKFCQGEENNRNIATATIPIIKYHVDVTDIRFFAHAICDRLKKTVSLTRNLPIDSTDVLHRCLPYVCDNVKKTLGEDTFFVGALVNIHPYPFEEMKTVQILKEFSRVSESCRKLIRGSMNIEKWFRYIQPHNVPHAEENEILELLRNVAMQVELPESFYKHRIQLDSSYRYHERNIEIRNYNLLDDLTRSYLFTEKAYFQSSIMTAVICGTPALPEYLLQHFNSAILEVCFTSPAVIPLEKVELAGINEFVMEKCLKSVYEGPIMFGMFTIQLLLVNDFHMIKEFKKEKETIVTLRDDESKSNSIRDMAHRILGEFNWDD